MWGGEVRKFQRLIAIAGFLVTLVVETNSASNLLDQEWWKQTIVYQIYPRSFQDSNGDGVGDLKGITSRLDHFNYLNVGTIWLSPFYKSPMVDFGYDIEDFTDVDPVFGTLGDFDDLVREAHNRGIHVLVDFIPNHTSDKHFWFEESRKGGSAVENPYTDFYIWDDGKLLPDGTRVAPNNWLSVFTGDTWTWDPLRQQFYFHQFTPEQPDLNYRNPDVRQKILEILQFWLDRDVDGFRVDAIGTLFEVTDRTQDEPRSNNENVSERDYDYLSHIYTTNQPEIHEVIREWRDLFDKHDQRTGKHTFMVMEIYDETYVESMKYYHSGSDMPFNFDLIEINKTFDGKCIKSLVTSWLNHMPQGKWPNYVLGNHDRHRVSARKGLQYADALNVLLLTLPGTPTTYYGEEIAMNEIEIDYEDVQDPWAKNVGPELSYMYNRDLCRAPMQWNSGINAGFSSAERTWLPVHPDYKVRNVEAQMHQGPQSHIEIYRLAAKLREEKALQTSDIIFLETEPSIVAYVRYNPDEPQLVYLITINLSKFPTSQDHKVMLFGRSFTSGQVILNTESQTFVGKKISLNGINLKSGQALILKLSSTQKEEL